jgi:hypothetical protein
MVLEMFISHLAWAVAPAIINLPHSLKKLIEFYSFVLTELDPSMPLPPHIISLSVLTSDSWLHLRKTVEGS